MMILPGPKRAGKQNTISSQFDFFSRRSLTQFCAAGAILISLAAHSQGTLNNGVTASGTLSTGQSNAWTFPANAGDSIVLRMGSDVLNPKLQLFSPLGTLLGSSGSANGGFV